MITLFKNVSIAQKLRRIIVLISAIALIIASVSYITMEIMAYRKNLVEQMTILADFIGTNSTASLIFEDKARFGFDDFVFESSNDTDLEVMQTAVGRLQMNLVFGRVDT